MANAQSAWDNAETRCYEFIKERLDGESGVTAYKPDDGLPRTISAPSEAEMWTFEINGGSRVLQIQTAPACCWSMNAMFRGVFTSRSRAKRIAGLLMDILPPPRNSLTGVQKLHAAEGSGPSIMRGTAIVANDQDQGGEIIVWQLEYPMDVVFNNRTV